MSDQWPNWMYISVSGNEVTHRSKWPMTDARYDEYWNVPKFGFQICQQPTMLHVNSSLVLSSVTASIRISRSQFISNGNNLRWSSVFIVHMILPFYSTTMTWCEMGSLLTSSLSVRMKCMHLLALRERFIIIFLHCFVSKACISYCSLLSLHLCTDNSTSLSHARHNCQL